MAKVTLKWQGEKHFAPEGTTLEALDPKTLMLAAMGKCSGITAVMLMAKMHIEPKSVAVDAEGTFAQDPMIPEVGYDGFHETFHIECEPKDIEKVLHAVDMTLNKYCGVTLMYKKIAPITHTIYINGKRH